LLVELIELSIESAAYVYGHRNSS